MKYKPVASLKETIVAGAEFESHSALLFMELVSQKSEVEHRIHELREKAFLNGEYVTDISYDDINTEDISLTNGQLNEIDSLNLSDWKTAIEDCYRFRNSRDPEDPLDRLHSVSINFDLPTVDTNSLSFDMDKVRLTNFDQKEAIEVHMDSENSLVLHINTDNMEFYQGMYDPPVTQSINTLSGYTDMFDSLTIRNNSSIGKELMESFKPETVERELESTEIIFGRDFDSLTYLPESECLDSSESSTLKEDINILMTCSPLPDEETKIEIMKTLENGYITSETALKILLLIIENKRINLPYSYLASPEYLEQIERLTDTNLVSVPQEEMIIFTEETPPEWMKELDREFPKNNDINIEQEREINNYLDTPDFIDRTNSWRENIRSKEKLLQLFENGEIDQDDIVSYYFVPWDCIRPNTNSIKECISYGHKLREKVQKIDDKYGTNLYKSTIIWEKRKIYRKEEHQKD
jgi:hypothetical protein